MFADADFTLVIPAFNESNRILPTLDRVVTFLSQSSVAYEVIVVDDGSTDDTLRKCQEYALGFPRVRVLSYGTNRGKGYAVKTGVMASSGKVVAFSDADMPVPPEQYGQFLTALKHGSDLAIGSRYLPASHWDMPAGRRLAGRAFRFLARLLAGGGASDTQFGFKLFTSSAAKDIFSRLTIRGFAFDAELIHIARDLGYQIEELPVRGVNAPGSTVRPVRDAIKMLWQLSMIRFRAHGSVEEGLEPAEAAGSTQGQL